MKGREVGGNFPHTEAMGGLPFSYMVLHLLYNIYIFICGLVLRLTGGEIRYLTHFNLKDTD